MANFAASNTNTDSNLYVMTSYLNLLLRFQEAHRIRPFSTSQYVFYMELLAECNRQNWPRRFSVPPRYFETCAHCSRGTVCDVRRELCRRGFITFKPGVGRSSATYGICGLYDDDTADLAGEEAAPRRARSVTAGSDSKPDTSAGTIPDTSGKGACV